MACGTASSDEISSDASSPPGTRALERGADHWRGWLELVPAIATPRTAARDDRTQVLVRFPGGARVTLDDPADPRSLRVPAGTVIDRVESRRIGGRMRAVDVRGTRFERDGSETFRAYRARTARDVDRLFGVEWSRGDASAAARASGSMRDAMHDGLGFVARDPHRRGAMIDRYTRLLSCEGCHQPRRPERAHGPDAGPRRATDASGLYTLLATLADDAIVETYRPIDANEHRAQLTRSCADGSAPRVGARSPWPRCDDRSVPRAHLDVRAAIADGDPAAAALCASRRALAPFLSEEVRQAYASELAACGEPTTASLRAEARITSGEFE
ncbi:MAG: hypothetical protein M3Y87_10635 [Myxococcota bacterium]|nr:hypothetical protein [Myxococcota bacterium]